MLLYGSSPLARGTLTDPPRRRQVLDVPWVYEAILDAVLRELKLAPAAEKNS